MFFFFQTFHLCFSYSLVSICVYEIRARDLSHKLTLWKATNRASVWVCKKIFLYFFLWRIAILVIQTKNFQIIPGNPKQSLYLENILNLKIYNFAFLDICGIWWFFYEILGILSNIPLLKWHWLIMKLWWWGWDVLNTLKIFGKYAGVGNVLNVSKYSTF